MKKALWLLGLCVSVMFWAGCSSSGGGGGGGGGINEILVNTSGQAWDDRYGDGIIFNANGTFSTIAQMSNGTWVIDGTGTWQTSGNTVTTSGSSGYYGNTSGTLSGNTLSMRGYELVKTNVTVISGTPGQDSRLVNTAANEAWLDDWSAGERDGVILRQNGTFTWIYEDGVPNQWFVDGTGTWQTLNNNIIGLNWGYGYEYASYSVTNSNRIVIDGDWVFNRTSNVVITNFVGGAPHQVRSDEKSDNLPNRNLFNAERKKQ